MMYSKIEDLDQEAKDLIISFFKDKENFNKIISIIAARFQVLEDVIFDAMEKTEIEGMEGVQLDLTGEQFGVLRNGRGDEEYRQAIKGSPFIRSRSGTAEDIYSLAQVLFTNGLSFQIVETYPAGITIYIGLEDSLSLSSSLESSISEQFQDAKAAGVNLRTVLFDEGEAFTLSSLPDTIETDINQGFGDENDPNVGGKFSHVI